jgi:hypothetical protein
MRPLVLSALLVIGVSSCGKTDSTVRRDSLTQRERDSILGASQLPGAQGVRGALKATGIGRLVARELTQTSEGWSLWTSLLDVASPFSQCP